MSESPKAPESIATARLHLRRPTAADVDDMFARYASDPIVTRYLSWPTHRSRADTEAFLAYSDAEWNRSGTGTFLILAKGDDRLLGSSGLSVVAPGAAVTGYVLAQDAWGKGYATETLAAMVTLATTLGAPRVTAACHADHVASQRVLEKCGFTHTGRQPGTTMFPNLGVTDSRDYLVYTR